MISHGDAAIAGLKKTTVTSTSTTTRRAALGNLVNRTDKPRAVNDKKAISNSNENLKGGIDLKNVKARVDTHWKNEPVRKPISVSKPSITSIGSTGSIQSGPKLVKTKVIETAIIKEVKIEKPMPLKRQDSTLTRRLKPVSSTTSIPKIQGKSQLIRVDKSAESEAISTTHIVDVPPVQSRFRPPSFTASYTNGLIDGVST